MATTRLGAWGHGTRPTGNFASKTPGVGATHPVVRITRLGAAGYGVRRSGSFTGKTTGAGGGGTHPVGRITRLNHAGFGTRRCGSFAGRIASLPGVQKPIGGTLFAAQVLPGINLRGLNPEFWRRRYKSRKRYEVDAEETQQQQAKQELETAVVSVVTKAIGKSEERAVALAFAERDLQEYLNRYQLQLNTVLVQILKDEYARQREYAMQQELEEAMIVLMLFEM